MLNELERSNETAMCVTTVLTEYQIGNLEKMYSIAKNLLNASRTDSPL